VVEASGSGEAMSAARSRFGLDTVSKASDLADSRRLAQRILAAEERFTW